MINGPRTTGNVVEWKGTSGWIVPDKPLRHPSAHKNQGRVYLAAQDVSEDLDGVGASVSFQLYSDATGLGAADCRMAHSPRAKAQAKAKVAAAAMVQQTAFQKRTSPLTQQPKAAPKAFKGEKEILHQKPLLGTVNSWRGKFGFITPDDTIEHPMANRHNGELYFDHTDVQEEIGGVGARVRYVLYADSKGLGAMKVTPP